MLDRASRSGISRQRRVERTAMFNSRHGEFLRGVGGEAISIVAFAAITLSSCSVIGPASIDHGRTSYNEVIEDTSRQQALLNVVRVSNGESPLFMDVTEVDAATSAGGTLGSGATGLGSTANFKSTGRNNSWTSRIHHGIGVLSGGADRPLFSSFRQRSHCSSLDTDKARVHLLIFTIPIGLSRPF